MNIIPEETIAVWARERRVLCKIFFISPLILMSRETKIRPTEHQSSATRWMDAFTFIVNYYVTHIKKHKNSYENPLNVTVD